MRIFKPVTLQWWQTAVLKVTVGAAGAFIGVLFAEYLRPFVGLFLVLYVAGSLYLSYIWIGKK